MNSIGRVEVDGLELFIHLRDLKSEQNITLFSKQHREDRVKFNLDTPNVHPVIQEPPQMFTYATVDYIMESFKRLKKSGKCSSFRGYTLVEKILGKISMAQNYNFRKSDIIVDNNYTDGASIIYMFEASDSNVTFRMIMENSLIREMYIKSAGFTLSLSESNRKFTNLSIKDLERTDISDIDKKRISIFSVKDVTFEDIVKSHDVSWYYTVEEGFKYTFKAITTIEEFETIIISGLVREAIRLSVNKEGPLYIGLDTETSGFTLYNLSDDNEAKDSMCAIPICFSDTESYVIFTDMENFQNISKEYAIRRLTEVFEEFNGEREINIYEDSSVSNNVESEVTAVKDNVIDFMTSFTQDTAASATEASSIVEPEFSSIDEALQGLVPSTVVITRDMFNVIAYNLLFDKRVMYAESVKLFKSMTKCLYFDDDALQMAFNLNPGFVKHSRALKPISKRLLNIESPDLGDILGKGNEDKYRYLKDIRVAILYGAADAFLTRRVFFVLKNLTPKSMYTRYKYLDVKMMNILAISEYYGLPINEEAVMRLAKDAETDIEKIKQFLYSYVGAYVDYGNKKITALSQYKTGSIDYEQYTKIINNITIDKKAKYLFEFKPRSIGNILYNVLKYPVLSWTAGEKPVPSTDKNVMEKLIKVKLNENETPFFILKDHIYATGYTKADYEAAVAKKGEKKASYMLIINKDEFNTCKYQVALVLSKYGVINKEFVSYFKPMLTSNLEGKIFKNYSLARIETRRIMNPSQTMKGSLKANVTAYSKDYYLIDFDMSQVEYRIMLSISKFIEMIMRMEHPEKDYHTETSSLVFFVKTHRVTKEQRSSAKSVSFGVPYGLGEYKLCEKMFGVVNEVNLQATRALLNNWKKANGPVMDMLNEKRDEALRPVEVTTEFRDFIDFWERDKETKEYVLDLQGNKIPIPVGFVYDEYGFYRIFDLSDLDNRKINSIRNAAGNFPIQCYAAELFRTILLQFYDRCTQEGIQDKIIWHMLIHDELLLSCHKSLNPFYMYKLIKEECMIQPPGHTKYFVGINVGLTWAETKDDSREAPVFFVREMVDRWDAGEFKDGPYWFDDPWAFIKPYREDYILRRIGDAIKEELEPLLPGKFEEVPIDIPLILDKFENYTVRKYVYDYPMSFKVSSDYNPADLGAVEIYETLVWCSRFEEWVVKRFGPNKEIIDYYGNLRIAGSLADTTQSSVVEEVDTFMDLDFSELFDDDIHVDTNWSFDMKSLDSYYDDTFDYTPTEYVYDEDTVMGKVERISADSGVTTSTALEKLLTVKLSKYNNIKVTGTKISITAKNVTKERIVRQFVADNKAIKGYSVAMTTFNGSLKILGNVLTNVDLDKLDKLLD